MDKIFETVGLDGPYQKILFIINLFTGVLPCIYSFQIPFLTRHPSFFVQKLNMKWNLTMIYAILLYIK